jgi:hypothetical protein
MTRSRTASAGFRRKRARRIRIAFVRPLSRSGRRALRELWAAPLPVRLVAGTAAVLLLVLGLNWIYQVIRKPAEMFFPVDSVLRKSPSETWRQYGPLFREHSTAVMTPELLAALAQVEGSGNPVARTYWRWQWSWNPFEIYQPASSAVGMYQITNAAFQDARRFCIHNHAVAEDGPWNDWRSCWFNGFYTRVIPSHAVEMTSAFLDRSVARTLARQRIAASTPQQKQDLAAVIHLCGPGAGDAYARRGFQPGAAARCGDHDVRIYLARVNAMKRTFAWQAASGRGEE